MLDLIIIGAGPAGIAAAYEAKKHNLNYLVIEKGLIGNTIYNYPVGLTVFSTTDELELEPGTLKPAREKPTREELLSYYVRFVLDNELKVQTEESVESIESVESGESIESFESIESVESGESIESIESVESVESVESGESIESVMAGANSGSTDSIDPTDTIDSIDSPDSIDSKDSIDSQDSTGSFLVTTNKGTYSTRNVLFAMGAMDYPRRLNVPGEDLPKVFDHFRETYPWVKKRALIVGGGNSAGEAALFLAEEGADTTLAIFRSDWENNDPKQGCIKYWVKQPLENELQKHCLKLFFLGKVLEITEDTVILENENGARDVLPNDVVFVLIGADADLTMLKSLGVETTEGGKYGEVPVYDDQTFETNVPGVYVAGHFTRHRHIKGAIDAAKILVPKIAEKIGPKARGAT